MHRCVCIWRYILQNYNYKLHFQNLSIYHIPHVSIETLAAEYLDVCTTCDSLDSNIHLTMGKDWRRQIYPNVLQCLTLTFVDSHHKCHSNRKLTTTQNKWPISPKGGHWRTPKLLVRLKTSLNKQRNCLELGARSQLSALEGVEGRAEAPGLD
jgi:hypothetical protein